MFKRVLLIDDNDADLLYGRIILERGGVAQEVVALESAREALSLLASPQAFDLILLDINMPGMDGFDFLRAYERLCAEAGPAVPVVMLTSSDDPLDRQKAKAFAAVRGYVVKPLDREAAQDLLTRLK